MTITDRNSNKWYDDECANHKRILRKAERDYRKAYNNDHLDKFRIFQREHNHLLYEKRYEHNKTLIQEADRDIKNFIIYHTIY